MFKINNQSNRLDNINFVQDISPETAANYSGGADFIFGSSTEFADIVLHKDPNGTGQAMGINAPVGELVNIGLFPGGETTFNDVVSSITTQFGTQWQFFENADGTGNTGIASLDNGVTNLLENDDKITAIMRIN